MTHSPLGSAPQLSCCLGLLCATTCPATVTPYTSLPNLTWTAMQACKARTSHAGMGVCQAGQADAQRQRRTAGTISRQAVPSSITSMYSSNLGVLQPVVEQSVSPAEDPYAMQRVSVDSFSSRGYYLDGSAIFSSMVLLVIMLALMFQRILGLDRFINQAVMKWKESRQYEQRNQVIKARQALEDTWDGSSDSSDDVK